MTPLQAEISAYNDIVTKIELFDQHLHFNRFVSTKGRKLALPIKTILSLAVFKQLYGIETKKSLYDIFRPNCSYKTLVVNLNRMAPLAAVLLVIIVQLNQLFAHAVKHTDSTDIPVCLNRKARYHQTMKLLASWGKTGKGWFYGLKLHLTTDLNRRILAIRFSSGRVDDRKMFLSMNSDLDGVFIVDAGYIGQQFAQTFYQAGQRIVFAQPRKNMKKLITDFQNLLYSTRMLIELNFRNLKLFHGLVTSLPRSVNGYLANYIYSLLAYCLR